MKPTEPEPTDYTNADFARYLVVFFATIVVIVGSVWIYTARYPAAFMESGYASWTTKKAMLGRCDLGQIAFFGDSRLEAAVVPADLPVPATNFGLAAGTAVEVRIAVDRALACPNRPRQAVISLVPQHFGPMSQFYWLLSIRYGFLTADDVWAVRRLASELGDHDTLATPTPDGMTGSLRDAVYASGFPSLSFGSLVQGRIIGRWDTNKARMAEVDADRGWSAYAGGARVKAENADRFVVTKLQNAEFEAALGALEAAGIPTTLLIMPFAADHQETDAVIADYAAYLAKVARSSGATLLDPVPPIWPASDFADGAHLAAPAAHAFTRLLARCLKDGLLQPPCDLAAP